MQFLADGDSGNLIGALITPTKGDASAVGSAASGAIYFQPADVTYGGSTRPGVKVTLSLTGLNASTIYSLHVHQYGYLDNRGASADATTLGSHWNPYNQVHGNLFKGQNRHAGDLGSFARVGSFIRSLILCFIR